MNQDTVLLMILLMSCVVLVTRIGGYALGLGFQKTEKLRGILEVLPGCAMMALIVPGAINGALFEIIALCLTSLTMWKTGSVAAATLLGLGILLGSSLI
ncbi:MAG: hypothetical protein GKR96_13440 [Gammaproteobacteria bacterium]|nr:hypothetical protein [Gammaproteobacteria bacterium]